MTRTRHPGDSSDDEDEEEEDDVPNMPDSPAPLTFWLTDRTRSKTGLGRCKRKRYLSTSFGPTGYGITARSESLPLTTGLAVHEGLEALCLILQHEDRLPTAAETRAIAEGCKVRYRAKVDARGFLGILKGPVTDETIREQEVLIAGLVWVLRLNFLPWLHEGYKVIAVETERLHFLTCTCGAGPLDVAEHVRRQCQGKVLMIRTDILAQRRGAQTLAYFEGKTTGWESDAWAEQWETDPQLALGTLDTEKIYGAEVTEIYIVGIGKGRRAKDRYEPVEGETPRKIQQSPLCYGYCRPGNPPLMPDDWVWSYEWVDKDGATRRKSKAHRRRGIWELPQSDWPTWLAYHAQDPEMPPEEFWVRMLPGSILDKVCFLLGPMNRQDAQLTSLRTSMIADEEDWQEILWELYEAQQRYRWESPEFQELLDRLVPCSWQCRPYGKEHQCEMVRICHRHEGWQDPIGSGHFVPRRPHHEAELQQAIARGLIVEQAEEVDDDEQR